MMTRHTVSDDAVERLSILFSEQLLLAALDLIDRDCGKENPTFSERNNNRINDHVVIKYVSPWGKSHFTVLGITGSYTVFPSLHQSCSIPLYCTCPAFAYAVLISRSQITVRLRSDSLFLIPAYDRKVIIHSVNTS